MRKLLLASGLLMITTFLQADASLVVSSTEGDPEICAEVVPMLDKMVEYEKSKEVYIYFDTWESYYREAAGKDKDGSMYAHKCPNWFEHDYIEQFRRTLIMFSEIDVNGTKQTLMWIEAIEENEQAGMIALVDKETCAYKALAKRLPYREISPWFKYSLVRIGEKYYLKKTTTYYSLFIDLYLLDLNIYMPDLESSKKRCVIKLEKSKKEEK